MIFDTLLFGSRKKTPVIAIPREIAEYRLEERRSNRYTFTSTKALVGYFTAWLSEEEIRDVVRTAEIGFVPRYGCSKEETNLQHLKKCEYLLVRLLRSGVAA